jgi:hypothetical protein
MGQSMQNTSNQKQWLSPKEASLVYGIGFSTFAKWRLQGAGPAYTKLGSKILYNRDDIDAFLKSKRAVNTSQYDA